MHIDMPKATLPRTSTARTLHVNPPCQKVVFGTYNRERTAPIFYCFGVWIRFQPNVKIERTSLIEGVEKMSLRSAAGSRAHCFETSTGSAIRIAIQDPYIARTKSGCPIPLSFLSEPLFGEIRNHPVAQPSVVWKASSLCVLILRIVRTGCRHCLLREGWNRGSQKYPKGEDVDGHMDPEGLCL